MKYNVEEYECNVIIEKKNNKNTYIRVKEDNTIVVTTNYFVTKHQIKKMLDDNYNFLFKNLKRMERKQEQDEKFLLLGNEYNIIVMTDTKVEIVGSNIYTPSIKKLDSWLKKEMKDLFLKRIDYYYNLFEEDIPYPNMRIRKMTTRWGVCNRKSNTVTLNSELIKYDITKLDYVVVHELSHFIFFNHSKDFWNLVSKYCPNYKQIRKELRN